MINKRKSKVSLSSTRWAAYVSAGIASALSPATASADHSCTLEYPNVQLFDPLPRNGSFDRAFSRSLYRSDVNVFFSHAYSEFGSGVGVLAFGGSAPSSVMLSIAGFQNGNYFYASNPYYLQHFSTLNFVPAGERMDLAWGYGYTNSQFLNTGGYLAFRYDVGAGTQFGWFRISLDSGTPANIFTLRTFHTSESGTGELVGAIPLGGCVPEAGSLGLLATGAFGLMLWRRKRNQAQDG